MIFIDNLRPKQADSADPVTVHVPNVDEGERKKELDKYANAGDPKMEAKLPGTRTKIVIIPRHLEIIL
jgi:hypothetical protein